VGAPVQQVEPRELKKLWALITTHGVDHDAFRTYLAGMGLQSSKQLSPTQLETCLSEIDTRQGQAFQSPIRAHLFEALTTLQAEITQAEQTQPPGEPHAQALMELAEWSARVARDYDNPNTPEEQLQSHLTEVTESIQNLQELTEMDSAA
jgi:hypothetical protein